ncbi:MAG: NUDIX domain-containing protein, partial [Rubrivivax sp.]|nr:NUDIX domain-containing protein [Rubrivivax sp.]
LARVHGIADDPSQPRAERAMWSRAEALLPARGIEAYTQGLMDLGATVCTLRSPRCDACPLAGRCVARAEGEPQRYPAKTRRAARGRRAHALLWLQHGRRLWLVQRPGTGVWASLWSLPEFASDEALSGLVAGWPGQGEWLTPIEHALTHFDWALHPWRHVLPARLDAAARRRIEAALGAGRWFDRDDALRQGLPAPVRRLLESA